MLVAVTHHASPADDLEARNLRQLGQKIVLDTVGKRGVLSIVAQVLKRQHRDSRGHNRRHGDVGATRARHDMERLFGGKVFLETMVKVRKGWEDDTAVLARLGYESRRPT